MDYIKKLPKIELHCHLDGSLPRATIEELLGREVEDSELSVSEDCKSLTEYLQKFDLPLSALTSYTAFKKAAKDFVLSLQADNTIYAEVRFAPLLSVNANLKLRDIMEAVIEGLKEGKALTGIDVGLIACAMRHHEPEKSLRMFSEIRDYLGFGLNALDLAGDESKYSMSLFMDLFKKAKCMGYPFTIHAGECRDVRNVLLSVEAGALRIGHGIALSGQRDAIKLCKDKGIGIEMCPVSNLQTKAVDDIRAYPLREFLEAGLLVTVNTDNRTVSNSTMEKELEFVANEFALGEDVIKKLMINAANLAFADDNIKHNLLNKIL